MAPCLVLKDGKDFGYAAQGESAIASVLRCLGPRGADPIPFEEIVYGSWGVGAEDGVGLEDQEMFCGSEYCFIQMLICKHLRNRFPIRDGVV